jgi:CAAX protease family protein
VTNFEHLLALILFVGFPVWDVYETRRLKTSSNPRRKIVTYQRILAIEWAASLLAWMALRTRLFFIWPSAQRDSMQRIGTSFVIGVVAAMTFGFALQIVLTRRSSKTQEKVLKAFQRLAFILPVTRQERTWFLMVSITAGICEEILYRGFLMRYLADNPWHLQLWIALAIASFAFGMAHGYQGLSGIIGTAIIGGVLALVFVVSGNLWLPIALHVATDLRVLFLLRPGELAFETSRNR